MSKRLLRCYYTVLPGKNNRIVGTRCEKHFSFIQTDKSKGIHKLAFFHDHICQMWSPLIYNFLIASCDQLGEDFTLKYREKSFFITSFQLLISCVIHITTHKILKLIKIKGTLLELIEGFNLTAHFLFLKFILFYFELLNENRHINIFVQDNWLISKNLLEGYPVVSMYYIWQSICLYLNTLNYVYIFECKVDSCSLCDITCRYAYHSYIKIITAWSFLRSRTWLLSRSQIMDTHVRMM